MTDLEREIERLDLESARLRKAQLRSAAEIAMWLAIGVLVFLSMPGCGINEGIRDAGEATADRIMAPLSTQQFWYDVAKGFLRAWTETFPGGSATPNVAAGTDPWANADGPLMVGIYVLVFRPARAWVMGWLARRKENGKNGEGKA